MVVCVLALILWVGLVVCYKKGKFHDILDEKEAKLVCLLLFGSTLIAAFLFFMSFLEIYSGNEVFRNSYGEGKSQEVFEITLEGEFEDEPIQIEVGEQEYTAEETQEMFEKVMSELDQMILGENESKDRIEKDLNLITWIEDYPVEIEWELDCYDVINTEGEILETYDEEEGTLVEVRGTITYAEEEAIYVTSLMVFPEIKTEKEAWLEKIKIAIAEEEEKTRKQESFLLPHSIEGKRIKWKK